MDDNKCWNKHGEEGFNDRDLATDHTGQGISSHQQSVGHDGVERFLGSQDGESLNDSQTTEHDVNEDDLVDIGDNYVHVANQLERRWFVMPWGMVGIPIRSLRS
uniref:Uncharacterized protein n=1 Tax=Oryza brachyantha TaxID=4533 RepID=J3NCM5_ORYBR